MEGCSLLLPNTLQILYLPCNSVLEQRGASLVKGCCPAGSLHGRAGDVPSRALAMPLTQHPHTHTGQSCPALNRRLFLGTLRHHHLPLPWAGLTDPPFGELLVTVPPLLVQNMCTSVAMASTKRFLFSPLPFIFYFNNL